VCAKPGYISDLYSSWTLSDRYHEIGPEQVKQKSVKRRVIVSDA